MKKLTFLLLTCLPLLAFSCSSDYGMNGLNAVSGEGPSVRRSLDLDPFTGVKLAISADVTITQGDQQSVEVTGQDNIIDLITTEVHGDVWKITTSKRMRNTRSIHIYITIPRLTAASISGSGNIVGTNTFTKSDQLSLGLSGSGNIKLDVVTGDIDAGISGSGDMELTGTASSFSAGISGSGDIEALDLTTEQVSIRISGSGGVVIHATDELDVKISGSGDVHYRGQPRVSVHSSGSGNIKAI